MKANRKRNKNKDKRKRKENKIKKTKAPYPSIPNPVPNNAVTDRTPDPTCDPVPKLMLDITKEMCEFVLQTQVLLLDVGNKKWYRIK